MVLPTASKTVTLVIVLIIVFVVYHCLSIMLVNTNKTHLVKTLFFYKYNKIGGIVRKHLTRGFLCAVLDLSVTLWPLLIPAFSGIKRRGKRFPGLRNPGISLLFATLSLKRDPLMFCKPGILIFIFAENNYSIYAQAMFIRTPLFHQKINK